MAEGHAPQATPPLVGDSGSVPKKNRVKFPDHVEFKYDRDTPLSYASVECAELVRQMRGGRRDMSAVNDLIFKDAYVNAV